jgi:hypothetical protein
MGSERRAGVRATCLIFEQGEPWTDLRLTSGQTELIEEYKTTYPEPALQPGGPHQLCCRVCPGHQPSPSASRTFYTAQNEEMSSKKKPISVYLSYICN